MNFLMVIAAAGAWIIGEREEAAATLILFAIADRSRNMISGSGRLAGDSSRWRPSDRNPLSVEPTLLEEG